MAAWAMKPYLGIGLWVSYDSVGAGLPFPHGRLMYVDWRLGEWWPCSGSTVNPTIARSGRQLICSSFLLAGAGGLDSILAWAGGWGSWLSFRRTFATSSIRGGGAGGGRFGDLALFPVFVLNPGGFLLRLHGGQPLLERETLAGITDRAIFPPAHDDLREIWYWGRMQRKADYQGSFSRIARFINGQSAIPSRPQRANLRLVDAQAAPSTIRNTPAEPAIFFRSREYEILQRGPRFVHPGHSQISGAQRLDGQACNANMNFQLNIIRTAGNTSKTAWVFSTERTTVPNNSSRTSVFKQWGFLRFKRIPDRTTLPDRRSYDHDDNSQTRPERS